MIRALLSPLRTPSEQAGFTLVEVIVAVTLLVVVTSLVSSATFTVLRIQSKWRDDVTATKEARDVGSRFAADALNAVTTTLIDGANATSSVSLHWTDAYGVFHTAKYSRSGATKPYAAVREFDGLQREIADHLDSLGFRLTGRTLVLEIEVQASEGFTVTSTLNTYLRYMK